MIYIPVNPMLNGIEVLPVENVLNCSFANYFAEYNLTFPGEALAVFEKLKTEMISANMIGERWADDKPYYCPEYNTDGYSIIKKTAIEKLDLDTNGPEPVLFINVRGGFKDYKYVLYPADDELPLIREYLKAKMS